MRRLAAVPFLLVVIGACSDPTGPPVGTLELSVATSGRDLDPDGYTVALDGGAAVALPINGTVTLTGVAPGVHTLTVGGLLDNCALQGMSPVRINIPNDVGATASLRVSCTLINSLAFSRDSSVYVTGIAPGSMPVLTATDFVYPGWSPNGRTLALVSKGIANSSGFPPDQAIYLANADGGDLRQVTSLSYTIAPTPVWSPDGQTLLFIRHRTFMPSSSFLARVNIDGTGKEPFPLPPQLVDRFFFGPASWSPDGSRIALVLMGTVYTVTPDGTIVQALGKGEEAAWSPAGTDIAFVASDGHIHLIRPDSTNDRDLHVSGGDIHWSPDGTQLAFTVSGDVTQYPYLSEYVINADGTGLVALASGLQVSPSLAWSFDGIHLALIAWASSAAEIAHQGQAYIVRNDGSGLEPVGDLGDVCCVAWRP